MELELPRVLGPDLLARFGISRSRARTELRRRRWHRLAPGIVLTRQDEPTRTDWAHAGVILAGPTAAVTGWDAARARGVGDRRPPDHPVVVVSHTAMNRVVGGVRIRRTERPYTRWRQPFGAPLELLPLVRLPRAVADAALLCHDLDTVRALVSAAVQKGRCTVPALLSEYDDGPRNRSRRLRIALEDLRDGARSVAEANAAHKLAGGPIPAFELNVPVVDEFGTLLRVVDVLWRALRAALEIDGREFHFSEADWVNTLRRHNQLTRYGLAITHYPPRLVSRRDGSFVTEVAAWLRGRSRELGVRLPPGRGPLRPQSGYGPAPFVVQTATIA
jgi:hypothetical protein